MSELVTLIQLISGLGKLILFIIIAYAIIISGIDLLNLLIRVFSPY